MMRKIVLSLIASLGLCSLALAQNKQVSGTVTDADGIAAIGEIGRASCRERV